MALPLKTYDSVIAARYLRALAFEKKQVLNVTKLQKLLYIAYGYCLAQGHLLVDESPKAWPYGPVFPKVRNKVNYDISEMLDNADFTEIKQDAGLTDLFNSLIDKYANFTASQLSEWSHMKGSPWDKATKEPGFTWNNELAKEDIKSYFSTIDV